MLGVCLGHQALGQYFGGTVAHAPQLMHGRTSVVEHEGRSVFAGVPSPFTATRYHSLTVVPETVPEILEVTARTADGSCRASPTASCRCTACSSTPSRCSPSTAT
jgi:para-aminobenzoate synthetase component 2